MYSKKDDYFYEGTKIKNIDGWCNGSTTDFESVSKGSNPLLSATGYNSV